MLVLWLLLDVVRVGSDRVPHLSASMSCRTMEVRPVICRAACTHTHTHTQEGWGHCVWVIYMASAGCPCPTRPQAHHEHQRDHIHGLVQVAWLEQQVAHIGEAAAQLVTSHEAAVARLKAELLPGIVLLDGITQYAAGEGEGSSVTCLQCRQQVVDEHIRQGAEQLQQVEGEPELRGSLADAVHAAARCVTWLGPETC